MKVTVFLSDGGQLVIAEFDEASALDLKAELGGGNFLTFDMDGSTVVVNPQHVVRVDFDE